MKVLSFILLILFPLMINAQKNSVKNINNLSFELLKQINKANGNKNIFISAYSISNALAMTYIGAKAETKTEMENILFPNNENTIPQDLKALNDALSFNRKIELYSANNIWIKQNMDIKKSFTKNLKINFNADIRQANFSTTDGIEKTRNDINTWVEEKTKNNIKDFLTKGILDESTVIVLVNAVYYYAQWKNRFEEKNTYQDNFYTIDGGKVKTNYMRSVLTIPYYKNNELTAIEIPYENNEASFIIVMPDNFENFAKKFDIQYFERITQRLENKKVRLSIPKFKEESEYELIEYFKNMGMTKLLSSQADLSGISGNKDIKISNIIHKAIIEINESGTEASAATAVIGSRSVTGSKEVEIFKANRPFFYFIKEKSTGVLLFAGSFVTP
ncbi:MAG: serpin family protein [Bacteroidales bacterium]|nr:serpin family protein [Bacteroidales bacterium]